MLDFARTQMGRTFFEHTLPSLLREIGRLNDLLARLVALEEQRRKP